MYQFSPMPIVYLSPQHGYDQSLKQTIKKQQIYEDPKLKVYNLLGENKRLIQQLNEIITDCEQQKSENLEGLVELHQLRGQKYEIEGVKGLANCRHDQGEKQRMNCNKLENENKQLKQCIIELQSKNTIVYDEIQNLKVKYSDLDQDRLKQVENARFDSDNQRIMEIEEVRKTYEHQERELENNLVIVQEEYGRLKQQYEELNRESDRQSEDDDRIQGEIKRQKEVNKQLEKRLEQYLNQDDLSYDLVIMQEKNKYLMNENQKLYIENEKLTKRLQSMQIK